MPNFIARPLRESVTTSRSYGSRVKRSSFSKSREHGDIRLVLVDTQPGPNMLWLVANAAGDSSVSRERLMKLFSVPLILIFALTLSVRSYGGTLYASSAAGATGELFILNQATGAMIQNIGPLNDASSVNYPVTGLAFNPTTGVLYGSTGNKIAGTEARLVTINPATAQVTVIGQFNAGPVNTSGTPTTMADIGFDAAGNLYGVASIGGPNLYSINIATGQATLVGANGASTSTTGGGLAISSGGVYYGTPTSSRFGTYNSGTGVYTNIANPTKPAGGAYGALDYDGNVLYGLNVGSGSPPPTHLVTINTANGAVTDIGASVASLDAIAFLVPEPATIGLFAVGLAAIACRRRRQ